MKTATTLGMMTLTFALCACGGGSQPPQTPSSTEPTQATSPTPTTGTETPAPTATASPGSTGALPAKAPPAEQPGGKSTSVSSPPSTGVCKTYAAGMTPDQCGFIAKGCCHGSLAAACSAAGCATGKCTAAETQPAKVSCK